MSHSPDSRPRAFESDPAFALEPLAPGHADELFAGLSDPALYEYLTEAPPFSVERLRARYEYLSNGRSPDGRDIWLNWVIRALSDGLCAGYVQATISSEGSALIGYVLGRAHQGRGLARAAVRQVLELVRTRYGVGTFVATVDCRNRKSCALLESLGFVRAIVRREVEWIDGVLTDEAEYRLTTTPTSS